MFAGPVTTAFLISMAGGIASAQTLEENVHAEYLRSYQHCMQDAKDTRMTSEMCATRARGWAENRRRHLTLIETEKRECPYRPAPQIGMHISEMTNWGRPSKITETETAQGTTTF